MRKEMRMSIVTVATVLTVMIGWIVYSSSQVSDVNDNVVEVTAVVDDLQVINLKEEFVAISLCEGTYESYGLRNSVIVLEDTTMFATLSRNPNYHCTRLGYGPDVKKVIRNDANGAVEYECTDADADGYTTCNGDCDDGWRWANPNGLELCDDMTDNDCDGLVDQKDPDCAAR